MKISSVERCERGMERAVLDSDVKNALKTYYTECADIYTEPACRDAYIAAASLDSSQQMPKIVGECKTAYCPAFQDKNLDACQPGFQVTPENIVKAWPPLHEAILARDAKGFAPRVSRAMLVFYSRVTQRMGHSPLEGTAAPAAPGASGSAPSASAAPPESAAPAPNASAPAPSASAH